MNNPPWTLLRYIARNYFITFCLVLAALLGLVFMLDIVELMRRASRMETLSFGLIAQMAFFKLPETGNQMFPFAALISTMLTFYNLTKSNELTVARAAGVSVWQFVLPAVLMAVFIGVIQITVLNPVGAILLARYEQMDNRYLRGQSSAVEVSETGLWLRQNNKQGQTVIHAQTVNPKDWTLERVMVLNYRGQDDFVQRIDAYSAQLQPGAWKLKLAWTSKPEALPVYQENISIPTDLTSNKIEDSFASPRTISLWDLPRFIDAIERTGISVTKLKLHYQSLLSQPLLYAALVLLAATFALRQPRQGYVLLLIISGVLTGFIVFFLNDLTQALAATGFMPIFLAAWAPSIICLLTGTAALLHLEDG